MAVRSVLSASSTNPVLIEVRRGEEIESFHRGAIAIVDAEGHTLAAWGDVERPIFPRSAVKMIQALPLVESGAADRFRLTDAHIALACASHSGEPGHVGAVKSWLAQIGVSCDALACGVHAPLNDKAARDLAARGEEPTALHNNCSGKHAGFLTTARHVGGSVEGYTTRAHPVQNMVTQALSDMTESDFAAAPCGIDGCGIPAYALALRAVALGVAKLAAAKRLTGARRAAANRVLAAVSAHPWHVAGSGRFDTRAMSAQDTRCVVKTGAEGVHVAGIRGMGMGVAVKIDDGARRGAELALAAVLRLLGVLGSQHLDDWERAAVLNRRGELAGRAAPAQQWLAEAEKTLCPFRMLGSGPNWSAHVRR
jgi:L-asparaginase II